MQGMTMACCINCGITVADCGVSDGDPGLKLYGCYSCDILYEERQEYTPDGETKPWWKVSYRTFSEWRELRKQKAVGGEPSK